MAIITMVDETEITVPVTAKVSKTKEERDAIKAAKDAEKKAHALALLNVQLVIAQSRVTECDAWLRQTAIYTRSRKDATKQLAKHVAIVATLQSKIHTITKGE